jgi:nitrogen-specific signal transduction histidine kinase
MTAPLLRDTVPDADSRAMLDTIESCAQRGADIIKQLLTFARGSTGARVPLPVRHLLRDLDKIIRETFPRDIRPRVDTPEDLWLLLGDATQIHQAIMNLCVNARDAMPDGGLLTMSAKNVIVDAAFAAMAPGAKPGRHVCVSVTDTGSGIPTENLDHIFDPFFTTKEIGKGTGLGLATVLGIVHGHEGFVQVHSRMGHGTTFELYFPASPHAEVARTERREAMPPRGKGELILVVDDEAAVRDSLRRTLELHGYRVLTAPHGAEGLAAFSLHRDEVRVVLTDMMMPIMHGPAMINALRAMAPHLPVHA